MFDLRLRHSLLLLGLLPGLGNAIELLDERLELNAYGTLGQTRSSLDTPPYKLAPAYQYGVGDQWSSVLDNRLGAQLTFNASEQLSFITQVLVRRNGEDDVRNQTTWLYARWRPDEHWEARLGRIRQPLFLITEEFDVGYSLPWVRPPVELYSLAGESTFIDGGQLRYQTAVGDYTLRLDAHHGHMELDRDPLYNLENTYNSGLAVTLTDGSLTLRGSLLQAHTKLDAGRRQQVVDLIAAQDPSVAEDYDTTDIPRQRYANLGLRYEDGDWLVMAEYVRLWLEKPSMPDKQAYYLTLGHSFGDFTPYATYARQEVISSVNEYRLSGVPANAANALLSASNSEQHSYSLGVRWDFSPGLALKGQVDQVYQRGDAYGLQNAQLPAGREHFTVTSVVLDWAF